MGSLQAQLCVNRSEDSRRAPGVCRAHHLTRGVVFMLLACALVATGHAQGKPVVCRAGEGNFEAAFPTGVSVEVGAVRREGLARRVCEAALLWMKGKTIVASDDAEVDVDAFGIDLGLGAPVVTLQAKKTDAECCMTFQIFSLRRPPKLLRTITGGSYFRAADTDLDGQIEIWTTDSASLDGFEPGDIAWTEAAPTMVLRFVRGRLFDVSSEFQRYFDAQIAGLQSQLDPDDLRDFKSSSGRLPRPAYCSQADVRRGERLARTKECVVQIVWAYLYSGRREQAWDALDQMWPPADRDRIRAAILSARGRGIRAEIDGTSAISASGSQRRAEIVDERTVRTGQTPEIKLAGRTPEDKTVNLVRPVPI